MDTQSKSWAQRSADATSPLIQAVRAAGLHARNWTLPREFNPTEMDVCVAVYDAGDTFVGTLKVEGSRLVQGSPWSKRDAERFRVIEGEWARIAGVA